MRIGRKERCYRALSIIYHKRSYWYYGRYLIAKGEEWKTIMCMR